MADLSEIIKVLDAELEHDKINDYPNALNGLQVENNGVVQRVAVAVDASLDIAQKATQAQADLLIVHHGLFWTGLRTIERAYYKKLKLLIQNNVAVYSSHLPLDAHPRLGNNAEIARVLELADGKTGKPFFRNDDGTYLGRLLDCEIDRESLVELIEERISEHIHISAGGPKKVRRLGIVSGASGDGLVQAIAEGADSLLTGEGSHWTHQEAMERGLNLIYAGHYATEVFGVKALGRFLKEKFNLPWIFIDSPSGL